MRLLASLSVLAVLSLSCTRAVPSATQYPMPIPSAAQPAAAGRGDLAYARRAAEAIRTALGEWETDEAMERLPQEGLQLTEAGVAAGCAAAPGDLPVLVCHFGPAASQPVGQAIFWYDRDGWQSQLYPQVASKVAAERRDLLAELGCRLGCYSGIAGARQVTTWPEGGTELLVVVNLGFTGGQQAEEAHLLRFTGGEWHMVWVPGGGDWNYGHARVELSAKGIMQFKVRSTSWLRTDALAGYLQEPESGEHRRFTEKWLRKDQLYVMADRIEEPGPYSTLVRLIHYLSAGADEKAATLLGPDMDLEAVRKALAQKPLRQGWSVTRWGDHGFLLDRQKAGRPDLGVRFVQQGGDGGEWVLAEVWPTRP